MNNIKDVQTSVGVWKIKKPKAGVRNRAMAKAESDNGIVKKSVLMIELLPKCIAQRPDGFDADVPIEQVLDDLDMEDYDRLFVELSRMIKESEDKAGDEQKKT